MDITELNSKPSSKCAYHLHVRKMSNTVFQQSPATATLQVRGRGNLPTWKPLHTESSYLLAHSPNRSDGDTPNATATLDVYWIPRDTVQRRASWRPLSLLDNKSFLPLFHHAF